MDTERTAELRKIISHRKEFSAAEADVMQSMLDAADRLRLHHAQIINSVRAHMNHIDQHRSHAARTSAILRHAIEHGDRSAALCFRIKETEVRAIRLTKLREKRNADRRTRNLTIVRMAGRGWSNKAIARHVCLHPCTISRIIQAQTGPDD